MDRKNWKFFSARETADWWPCLNGRNLPSGIWAQGSFSLNDPRPRIVVVGTRVPTAYGRSLAADISKALASKGAVVVSGLAAGVDRIAHEAALESGGTTIAVLGTGLDRVYPEAHRELQMKLIPASGAVISEFSPGTGPERHHFPARNRLIAALSSAVVVVEGDEKSGALITARWAAEMGKEVFAVPGSIYSRMSRGPNFLISQGARPLLDIEELLEFAGPGGVQDGAQKKLLSVLDRGRLTLEDLAGQSGLSLEEASQGLLELEIAGRITREGVVYAVGALK